MSDYKKIIDELRKKLRLAEERESVLRSQFQEFRLHIDNTPLATVEFDSELRIKGWSTNAEKMFGWSSEEVTGKTLSEFRFVYEDDVKIVDKIIDDIRNKRKSRIHSINRNYRKDGSVITCEWNNSLLRDQENRIISIICFVQDITRRDDLEKKLSHSHNLLQYIIEHSRSAIAVHDRDLRYIYVSKRYLSEYNVKEENIIGRHHYEVFPDLPQKWRDVHQRALKGEVLSAEDDPYAKADGKVEWTRWECRPWYENDGSIGGIIVYTEVITRKKEAELELLRAKETAEQSDRLKTAFLQNMSHEVRTPLNTIVGFSQLISESNQTDSNLRYYSEMISTSSDKLIGIISDVLEISEIRTNQIRTTLGNIDIISVVNRIARSYKPVAEGKKIKFSFNLNIPGNSLEILTDKSKIEKICSHLLDNAIKFTSEGSVTLSACVEKGYFVLTVSDTGIGISPELQKIIFEPFRQLETEPSRTFGGNGLGLAIVKAYTEFLKGTLTLESEPGEGTTVTIRIPLETKDSGHITGEKTRARVPGEILIVEDEYSSYVYLKELLKDLNLKILRAINGEDAVNICKRNMNISLILMDIKMPVMDGHTAAQIIKTILPEVPIIAQTAFALESERSDYLNSFDELITKPIKRNEFRSMIGRYVDLKLRTDGQQSLQV